MYVNHEIQLHEFHVDTCFSNISIVFINAKCFLHYVLLLDHINVKLQVFLSSFLTFGCFMLTTNAVVFLEENDEHIRDPSQMAEIFNNHFSNLTKDLIDDKINAYDPDVLSKLVRKLNLTTKMAFPEMTTQQTLELVQAISTSKATGIDGLSARLVKIAAPAIALSLT